MEVAIVYESLFGNTRAVAEAIADGVRAADPAGHVTVMRAGDTRADEVARAELLIVGGPTHMRGMTSGLTRRKGLEAEEQAARNKGQEFQPEPGAEGPGVRDWIGALPRARRGAHAAAFDTRAGFRLAGGAARKISHRLRSHGYDVAARPAGFIIEDTEGPLRDGEAEKARAWGSELVRELVPAGGRG